MSEGDPNNAKGRQSQPLRLEDQLRRVRSASVEPAPASKPPKRRRKRHRLETRFFVMFLGILAVAVLVVAVRASESGQLESSEAPDPAATVSEPPPPTPPLPEPPPPPELPPSALPELPIELIENPHPIGVPVVLESTTGLMLSVTVGELREATNEVSDSGLPGPLPSGLTVAAFDVSLTHLDPQGENVFLSSLRPSVFSTNVDIRYGPVLEGVGWCGDIPGNIDDSAEVLGGGTFTYSACVIMPTNEIQGPNPILILSGIPAGPEVVAFA